MSGKGLLLVISGPSGVGKGTICDGLIKRENNIKLSISATTRKKRPSEIEGVNYFFKTKDEFEAMIKDGQFLEYMKLFNSNYYGTPKTYVEEELALGNSIILEIDYHGALSVKEIYPEAVLVFIAPPSLAELRSRLIHRNSEGSADIEDRMHTALHEIEMMEKYDYVIINGVLDKAVSSLQSIISAEKYRVCRNGEFLTKLREEIKQ